MKDYEEYEEEFYEEEDYEEEEEEEEESNEPRPAWTEAYLNTLGMSLRDFL